MSAIREGKEMIMPAGVLEMAGVEQVPREILPLGSHDDVLKVALEAASMGTWSFRVSDRAWAVCERARELYCLDAGLVIHDDELMRRIMHPDDIPVMWRAVQRAFDPQGEGRYFCEYRITRREGGWRWLSAWALVRFEGTGADRSAVMMTGASRDITPQREAEDALRLSEERYRAVVEAQTELVIRFETDGKILFANNAFARTAGMEPGQIIGRSFWDVLPAELHELKRNKIADLSGALPQQLYEAPLMSGNGMRWILWNKTGLRFGADGRCTEVQCSGVDITGRKKNQELLDAQKHSLEMLVQGAPLEEIFTYLVRTVEGQCDAEAVASILLLDEHGRIRHGAAPGLPDDYNAAIAGLTAMADLGTCSRAMITGDVVITPDIGTDPGWKDIKHLPLALGLKAAWSQPIKAGNGQILGSFGTYFKECREPSAQERRVVAVMAHVAALAMEQRRTEQALRENDRRKDEFLATLAHELRNPLAPMRTALDIMQTMSPDHAVSGRMTAMMDRQLGQLVRLVDDLLDINRISRGKINLRRGSVDLVAIARHAVEAAMPAFHAREQLLDVVLPAEPLPIHADATRIQQVIGNLLHNAGKFTPKGGRIVLEIRQEDDHIRISISDNGIGLAQEELGMIFEMFSRAATAQAQDQGGLGIGLSLVRDLVELHGGSVVAESAGLGQGSEFIVRLPMLQA